MQEKVPRIWRERERLRGGASKQRVLGLDGRGRDYWEDPDWRKAEAGGGEGSRE
jgi:hypothetical protein